MTERGEAERGEAERAETDEGTAGTEPLPFDSPVPGFGPREPEPEPEADLEDAVDDPEPGDPLPFDDEPATAAGGSARIEPAPASDVPDDEPVAQPRPAVDAPVDEVPVEEAPDAEVPVDEAPARERPAAGSRPRRGPGGRRPSLPRASGARPRGSADPLALALAPAVVCALLALAGWAALPLLAVLVGVLQLGLAAAWVAAVRPPDPRGVLAIAAVTAVVTDVILVRSEGASLAPVAGVVGLALGAAMLRQLMRRGRDSVTSALSATMGAVVLVVALGLLIVLGDVRPEGPLLGTALAAVAAAAAAGRLVESYTSRGTGGPGALVPALATVLAGTLAGLLAGLPGPGPGPGALVGVGVGIAVVLAAVTAGPAVRRPGGGVPAPLLLATLLPLAVAAAAAHALGRLVGV